MRIDELQAAQDEWRLAWEQVGTRTESKALSEWAGKWGWLVGSLNPEGVLTPEPAKVEAAAR